MRLNDFDLLNLHCLGTAVCRYVGIAELELPVEFEFDLSNPEDEARLVMALWVGESDESACSACCRLLDLDRDLSQRVSDVMERGTDLRNRLLSLAEQARNDPHFVAVEVTREATQGRLTE